MSFISPEKLLPLQRQKTHVRNMTIVAHVDHGKTSLADCLIASNGIISDRLAGRLMYMDSRTDEQERLITMKSSSISLAYVHKTRKRVPTTASDSSAKQCDHSGSATTAAVLRKSDDASFTVVEEKQVYLMNLIDSPGHVDFASEVSAALRATDGAFIVVDALQGPGVQTQVVLRQVWEEKLRPVLVINKLDKLITHLKLTPIQAYEHLKKTLEEVNAILASYFKRDVYEKQSEANASSCPTAAADQDSANATAGAAVALDQWTVDVDDASAECFFDPLKGNVAFCCARDGWGFRVGDFVDLYARKLKMSRRVLSRTIWGDFYVNKKTKAIDTKPCGPRSQPLFVELVLTTIWQVYRHLVLRPNKEKTNTIIETLGVQLSMQQRFSEKPEDLLRAVLSAWIPISKAVLGMAVEHLPSPVEAQSHRLEHLCPQLSQLPEEEDTPAVADTQEAAVTEGEQPAAAITVNATVSDQQRSHEQLYNEQRRLRKAIVECDRDGPLVAFISKVFPRSHLDTCSSASGTPQAIGGSASSAAALGQAVMPKPRARIRPSRGRPADAAPMQAEAEVQVISADSEQTPTPVSAVSASSPPPTPEESSAQVAAAGETEESEEDQFLAFTRVFSGTLRVGQQVLVLGARHNPLDSVDGTDVPTPHRITGIYLCMGRSMQPIAEAPAGNVVAVRGISARLIKCATLALTPACPSFAVLTAVSKPIVRVALEPKNPMQGTQLVKGLSSLHRADPCLQYEVLRTGEQVIMAAGELHLERCLRDLREQFAPGIDFIVSEPIVPFAETIVDAKRQFDPNRDPTRRPAAKESSGEVDSEESDGKKGPQRIVNLDNGDVEVWSADRQVSMLLSAEPLPAKIAQCLRVIAPEVRQLIKRSSSSLRDHRIQELFDRLTEQIELAGSLWRERWSHLWALGPRGMGPNVLFGLLDGELPANALDQFLRRTHVSDRTSATEGKEEDSTNSVIEELSHSIISGFQLACTAGPMCEEQMYGVAFSLKRIDRHEVSASEAEAVNISQGSLTGQVIAAMRAGCRAAFSNKAVRLVEPVYHAHLEVPQDFLAATYAVLSRRRAQILKDDLREGTETFVVEALLPVVESFGFSRELLTKTSGNASVPSLMLSDEWKILDEDPFFIPLSEEELEEFGDNYQYLKNTPRMLVDKIRERKGLFVRRQVIEGSSDKQRTLSRKK